jgi:diguanylate cyclase (GGDEF)-like protein/putative nucleotidyltransferase with HDIG domain
MTDAHPISKRARLWIALVCTVGACSIGAAVASWESADLLKFGTFLAVGILASGIRFELPGVPFFVSLAPLVALVAILELSPKETVLLVAPVALIQTLWRQHLNIQWKQAGLAVATMALASAAASWTYHSNYMLAWIGEPAIRLTLATTVLFLLSTIPVSIAIALAEKASAFAIWIEYHLILLPYYLAAEALALLVSFAIHLVGWPAVLLTGPVLYLVIQSYRLYVDRLENERKHAEAVSSLHLRTIEALAMAIEAKDDTTHDHLARVQVYALELAKELGLSEAEQEALRAASILHDIGKLAVPEHIISKPGRLTPEEFEKMKIHPIVGAEILERVQFPYPVVPIVLAHHEKWDGTGYPYGLRHEEIPIGARILAAVDCLDALATDRQYRRALPLDEAMKAVEKESGKSFDPHIVELLSKRYVELEKMAKARHQADTARLSKDVKVKRGVAPAAGFEAAAARPAPAAKGAPPADFLGAIAAARQEVQALFEISQELGNSLSLDETLSMLGVRLRRLVPHHSLVFWVRREGVLVPEYVAGDDFRLFSSLQIPLGHGLSGWVAENRRPILNGNPSVESGYLSDPLKYSTLRSAVAVPLVGVSDVAGVLALYHAERDAFTRDHLRILLAISSKIALSIENALRFRQAETSATTDYLTNLPNARSLFMQLDAELSRARRTGQPLAVLVLDLDGFKQINDRFGHLEGNRVLRAVSAGLRSVCREYDSLARMGGDEFVILLSGFKVGELDQKLEQFRNVVSQASRDLFAGDLLTVSIGVAHYPQDGADAEELLAEADRRMYKEKERGRQQRSMFALAAVHAAERQQTSTVQ